MDRIFLPASLVKQARRDWFSSLDTRLEQQSRPAAGYEPNPVAPMPLRDAVSPAGEGLLPFIINPATLHPQDVASDDSSWYLPLKPVMLDEQHYLLELENLIERLPDNKRVRIGLNNAAHLHWASNHPAYDYFLDIYLYAANHATVQFIENLLGKSIAGYYWIEDEKERKTLPDQLREILFPAGESFSAPLFISRNCYRKDALELSCSGCSRNPGTYTLNQRERKFTVVIRECITYLFLEIAEVFVRASEPVQ